MFTRMNSVSLDPQMLKGALALVLLALLDQEEDYGYSVVLKLRSAGFGDINESSVYPALARLERQGALASTLRQSSSGPARKYYRVTVDGKNEYDRLAAAWNELARAMDNALSPKEVSDVTA